MFREQKTPREMWILQSYIMSWLIRDFPGPAVFFFKQAHREQTQRSEVFGPMESMKSMESVPRKKSWEPKGTYSPQEIAGLNKADLANG